MHCNCIVANNTIVVNIICNYILVRYGENRGFTNFASIVKDKLDRISNGSVIVYTDFARLVGPIVCALNDYQIQAVGYYGSMSDEESHNSWHDGHVSVIVATRAFGLGINKKNIRLVI